MFSSISVALALLTLSADNQLRSAAVESIGPPQADAVVIDADQMPKNTTPQELKEVPCLGCANADPLSWSPCGGCGHCQRCQRLPLPAYMRGDMPPHIPYLAEPKSYYYFRPYNYTHILLQQEEVANYGGDMYNPYDTRLFDSLYNDLQSGETIKAP